MQVEFGPTECAFKKAHLLELCPRTKGLHDLLMEGKLGQPTDLSRILTFEKVKGQLTNIFYSMEASNTEYVPTGSSRCEGVS